MAYTFSHFLSGTGAPQPACRFSIHSSNLRSLICRMDTTPRCRPSGGGRGTRCSRSILSSEQVKSLGNDPPVLPTSCAHSASVVSCRSRSSLGATDAEAERYMSSDGCACTSLSALIPVCTARASKSARVVRTCSGERDMSLGARRRRGPTSTPLSSDSSARTREQAGLAQRDAQWAEPGRVAQSPDPGTQVHLSGQKQLGVTQYHRFDRRLVHEHFLKRVELAHSDASTVHAGKRLQGREHPLLLDYPSCDCFGDSNGGEPCAQGQGVLPQLSRLSLSHLRQRKPLHMDQLPTRLLGREFLIWPGDPISAPEPHLRCWARCRYGGIVQERVTHRNFIAGFRGYQVLVGSTNELLIDGAQRRARQEADIHSLFQKGRTVADR
eukprot:scaffold19698_cov125-Isochrysis_galbana.AAC.4